MLRIAAVGWVHPAELLTDELLNRAGQVPSDAQRALQWGMRHRYTVASRSFLREGGIISAAEMKQRFSETVDPLVQMAVDAAKIAIERAGISIDDVGMVLGDTATPIETIPAFAALVAGKLGIKVPAYDVTGITGALPLQIENLRAWRDEAIAPHTLLVSGNTPTPYLSFAEGDECSWILSDGAGAAIIEKTSDECGVIIEGARYMRARSEEGAAEEIYGLIRGGGEPSGAALDLIQDLSDELHIEGVTSWIIATPTLRSAHAVGEMLGGKEDTICWCADEGFSFGSTLYRGAEMLLQDTEWREKALLCAVGPDGGVGIVLVRRASIEE
jgi:hypothetical protein